MKDDDADDRKRDNPWPSTNAPYQEKAEQDGKLWGVFLFGFIGATVTTIAVSFPQFISSNCFLNQDQIGNQVPSWFCVNNYFFYHIVFFLWSSSCSC